MVDVEWLNSSAALTSSNQRKAVIKTINFFARGCRKASDGARCSSTANRRIAHNDGLPPTAMRSRRIAAPTCLCLRSLSTNEINAAFSRRRTDDRLPWNID